MGSVCEGEGSASAWLWFLSLSDTHTTLCPWGSQAQKLSENRILEDSGNLTLHI